jgi:hypothetical protein
MAAARKPSSYFSAPPTFRSTAGALGISRGWPHFAEHFDECFRRMWRFYLLSFAGDCRARSLQVYGILFRRDGLA